jgi:TldD protein
MTEPEAIELKLNAELLLDALERALNGGAAYAEVRGVAAIQNEVRVKNGEIKQMMSGEDNGWGLNVRVGAGWGFASSAELTPQSVQQITAQALHLAAASARVQPKGQAGSYGPPSTASGEYRSPVQIDPFKVPPREQLEMLFSAEANLRRFERVKVSEAHLQAFKSYKFFANTAGASQRQFITESGGGLSAIAVEGPYSYQRTFGRGGNYGQAGYEYILGLQLEDEALRVGREAHELVAAEAVPSGPATVVIGSNLAALMVHESCGHPTELDRVLGSENAFAGGSFLEPQMRGHFRYGSPAVNLTADATIPGALGTFGWDDEGTPARRTPLVEQGIFTGYLSSRDTAAAIGLPASGGAARASSWSRTPLVRMTNVSLEPGQGNLEDLISEVENGLYLETPSSWSLDDKRMNFHFSAEICREIKGGQLGRLYKGASFMERTPIFWGNVLKVAGPEEWKVWGFLSCAKGEPLQSAHVAHGASPVLVNNLTVQREGK